MNQVTKPMYKKTLFIILLGISVIVISAIGLMSFKNKEAISVPQTPKQTKPELPRRIEIPSSLGPGDIIVQVAPYTPLLGGEMIQEFLQINFGIDHLNDGFVEGAVAVWYGDIYYIKKDGTKVDGSISSYLPTLSLTVLKYKKPEFAKEDYNRITSKQELGSSSLEEIRLKTKSGVPSTIRKEVLSHTQIKPERWRQYLLYSNNFIVHGFGIKEAAEDIMIRLIDQYRVK